MLLMSINIMNMWNYKNLLTKISYLCIHVCIKQDIFRFQISMDHHMPVTVIHTRKDLLKQTPTFFFIQLRKVERHFKAVLFKNFSTYNSPTYKTVKMHETFHTNLILRHFWNGDMDTISTKLKCSEYPGTQASNSTLFPLLWLPCNSLFPLYFMSYFK